MRAQQNNPLPGCHGCVQVFESRDCRHRGQACVRCPAAKSHLEDRHAKRFEVAAGESIDGCGIEIRETKLDIASYDAASLLADAVRETTNHSADAQPSGMVRATETL